MAFDPFCDEYGHEDRYVPAKEGPTFYVCDRCGARNYGQVNLPAPKTTVKPNQRARTRPGRGRSGRPPRPSVR